MKIKFEKLENYLTKQIVDFPDFTGIEVDTVGDLEKLIKGILKVVNSNVDSSYDFDPSDLEGDSYLSDSLECIADNIENNLLEGHEVRITVEVLKRKGRPKES